MCLLLCHVTGRDGSTNPFGGATRASVRCGLRPMALSKALKRLRSGSVRAPLERLCRFGECADTRKCARIHAHMHARTRARATRGTHTHAHFHARAHAHTRTRTHVRAHAQQPAPTISAWLLQVYGASIQSQTKLIHARLGPGLSSQPSRLYAFLACLSQALWICARLRSATSAV
jgi:hypothetical protein